VIQKQRKWIAAAAAAVARIARAAKIARVQKIQNTRNTRKKQKTQKKQKNQRNSKKKRKSARVCVQNRVEVQTASSVTLSIEWTIKIMTMMMWKNKKNTLRDGSQTLAARNVAWRRA